MPICFQIQSKETVRKMKGQKMDFELLEHAVEAEEGIVTYYDLRASTPERVECYPEVTTDLTALQNLTETLGEESCTFEELELHLEELIS